MGVKRKAKGVSPARAERIARVLSMYDMDMSYRQIAEKLGISFSTVRDDYHIGIKETYRPAAEERIEKIERQYQTIRRAWWAKAVGGDPKAADIIMKSLRDERKLLGIDRPEKHELTVDAESTNLAEQITQTVSDLIDLGLSSADEDKDRP